MSTDIAVFGGVSFIIIIVIGPCIRLVLVNIRICLGGFYIVESSSPCNSAGRENRAKVYFIVAYIVAECNKWRKKIEIRTNISNPSDAFESPYS